jgi:hypothetical protein
MAKRTGEKIGWVGGWVGGFIWVFILSIVWLVQGKTIEGIAGLALVGVAVLVILATAPWKHPTTPCWKLMLPLYVMVGVSVVWAVWSFGGAEQTGLTWWSVWWVIPLLIPFGTAGRRRWSDADTPECVPANQDTRVG